MAEQAIIRRLVEADAVALRTIRLEALQLEPAHFGASFEEEREYEPAFFLAWLKQQNVFGGYVGLELAGIVSVGMRKRIKFSHVAELGAMYVRPAFRGMGLGGALVARALESVRPHAAMIVLSLNAANMNAVKLYKRYGFRSYGRLERGFLVGGVYHDDELMVHEFLPNSN